MARMTSEERREANERKSFFETLENELKKRNEAHALRNEPEEVYIFAYVPLKYIKTDDKYQRNLDKSRVATIKNNFDPYMVDVKKLNYRDGYAHAWDGKHTTTALMELGISTIPAMVTFNKTYEWEGRMFGRQLENSVRPNAVSRYLANVEAKVPEALAIKEELDKRGITTLRDRKRDETHNIFAFAKVLSIYNKFGIEGMNLTLDIIIESGYAKYKGGFSTWMLEVGRTLCRLEYEYNSPEYMTVLNKMRDEKDPSGFYSACVRKFRDKQGQHGEGPLVSYVKALVGVIPMPVDHE